MATRKPKKSTLISQSLLKRLREEHARYRDCLMAIHKYGRCGDRSTADGYPSEVAYDEYAYKRIVDTYREAAANALQIDP